MKLAHAQAAKANARVVTTPYCASCTLSWGARKMLSETRAKQAMGDCFTLMGQVKSGRIKVMFA
ncbi:MAG: hypothetical protein ACI89X_004787 [Planctomycetota bacterium]|jgi:hypothetical protein